MNDNQIIALIEKFHADTLSEEEALAFFRWYNEADKKEFERLLALSSVRHESAPGGYLHAERFMEKLAQRTDPENEDVAKGRLVLMSRRWWAAAAIVIVVMAGSVFTYLQMHRPSTAIASNAPLLITPGSNKATLKLADGSTILLDQAGEGNVATQGNIKIIKLDSGSLAYQGATSGDAGNNTLTTPMGGQFQVTLADGTKVWLNAASSIQYPATFSGDTRTVCLKGEAYFEVAKSSKQPFIVRTDRMDVQVLGTSFNIMAYHDEKETMTTLVDGAVNVMSGKALSALAPGQQAIAAGDGKLNKNLQPNMEEVLAWKKGEFRFEGAKITTIMRQVARWYDVEVVYEGKVPANEFSGVVSRKKDAQQLLEGLEIPGNVHFTIEGKKITVIAGPATKKP